MNKSFARASLVISLFAGLLSGSFAQSAQTIPAPADPAAASGVALVAPSSAGDADWKALNAIMAYRRPDFMDLPQREQFLVMDAHKENIVAAAQQFIAKHPDDPRRWDAAVIMIGMPRNFLLNPEASTLEEFIKDDVAEAAWKKERAEWLSKIMAAPDASAKAKETLDVRRFMEELSPVFEELKQDPALDLRPQRAKLDALLAKHPLSPQVAAPVDIYAHLLGQQNPEQVDALWREFARSPNDKIRERAQKALLLVEAKSTPLELRFTALDGREVDLAALRGKVVLIDFWATWCGPCIAELPNVRKVYADYHAKGFEIISVSLDQEKDKGKLIEFLKKNDMPWPQYFDGKAWKTELAVKYGINAVPAMFLLGRDGRIVSMEARGPKLEAEVKRLLSN